MISRRKLLLSGLSVGLTAKPSMSGWLPLANSSSFYTGLVATRARCPASIVTSGNKQMMGRTGHIARDNIIATKFLYPNWGIPNSGNRLETGTGGIATLKLGVEYPAGNFTQITFDSGSVSQVVADGATFVSDMVTLTTPIPSGAIFWLRPFFIGANGIIANAQFDQANFGDTNEIAASGLTDKTISGTVTILNNSCYYPLAVIGMTRRPSVVILGDSKELGKNDTYSNTSGDIGDIARWIGPNFGYTLLAQEGDRAAFFNASDTQRLLTFPFCSHVLCGYGSNDLYSASASIIAVEASLATIYSNATAAGALPCQATIPGRTTSAALWISNPGDQALVNATVNTRRNTINVDILAKTIAGLTGPVFDISTQITPRTNDTWIANGAVNWATSDGVHESFDSNIIIQNALQAQAAAQITR